MHCRLQVLFELIQCLSGGKLAILYRGKKGCGVDEVVFFGAFLRGATYLLLAGERAPLVDIVRIVKNRGFGFKASVGVARILTHLP